jgi:hypothetical protein
MKGSKHEYSLVKGISAFLISFGLSVFFLTQIIPVNAQIVGISPSTQDVSHYANPTITVDVNIQNVIELYGYQFDSTYNDTVLNFLNITEGDFLKGDGASTYWIPPQTSPGLLDNAASTRQGVHNGTNGSGNLAQINFVINPNFTEVPTSTQVRLPGVKLSDVQSNPIGPFQLNNGTINIKICLSGESKICGSSVGECQTGTQDCLTNDKWGSCVGEVGPTPEVCNGLDDDCDGNSDNVFETTDPLTRACSISHQGICTEGTETCTSGNWIGCPSPQQEICWDGIDQDCDGADSNCEGDIAPYPTPDGCIDILDLSAVALDFGKTSDFVNPNSDINSDGEVDIFDLVIVAKDFGSGTCT